MADGRRGRLPGGRRQRLLAGLVLILAAVVAVVLVVVNRSPTPAGAAAGPQPTGAATVRRRNLVQTDTEAGTLSYSNPQTVYDRLSGTITWLPSVGRLIRPGQTLFKVDGEPVVLMNGSTPAYRDLSPSDSDGTDVLQLNHNLIALGFDAGAIVADDAWQPATTVGVELAQESLGETTTGTLGLGQVVFLPGDQLVSTVDVTLGDGGSGAASTAAREPTSAPQFVGLTSSTTPTSPGQSPPTSSSTSSTSSTTSTTTTQSTSPPSSTTPTTRSPTGTPPQSGPSLAELMRLLQAETDQLKAEAQQLRAEANALRSGHGSPSGSRGAGGGGAGSGGSRSSGGGGSAAGTAVLQTTSPHLVVTVDLSASSQSEARVGARVAVQLPDGDTVGGRITAVSSVAQSASDNGSGGGSSGSGAGGGDNGGEGSGSGSTIPVTITLRGHHSGAGLDEAAVSVSFAQARARHVLSVPVTALVATAGGSYSVQAAAAPHRLIPVTTGLFAAGYVQISGPGIYPGLQVTDSQG